MDAERRREGNAGLGKRGASFGIHGLQFFSTLFGFAALLCKTIVALLGLLRFAVLLAGNLTVDPSWSWLAALPHLNLLCWKLCVQTITMHMGENLGENQTQYISPQTKSNVKRDDKSDKSHVAKKIAVTTRQMKIK